MDQKDPWHLRFLIYLIYFKYNVKQIFNRYLNNKYLIKKAKLDGKYKIYNKNRTKNVINIFMFRSFLRNYTNIIFLKMWKPVKG